MDLALGLALAALLLSLVALAAAGAITAALYLRHRSSSPSVPSRLEGELVLVNTPRPDERAYRGLVVRELPAGELELRGAEELERVPTRGGEDVRALRVGDAIVPGPRLGSAVQLLARDGR